MISSDSPSCEYFAPPLISHTTYTSRLCIGRMFKNGGHLGFPIGTILPIFDLQVSLMLPTKFQVKWSFGTGEKAKIYFQDGRMAAILDV